jgi:ribosomal protein S15P/S13E
MDRIFTLFFLALAVPAFAQQSGSFVVGGDLDKFYPVKVIDGAWDASTATVIEIGRAAVHLDADWRDSMIARFRFHGTRWGNGARFIDAEIIQIGNKLTVQNVPFVAGWRDATPNNGIYDMIIWLRGGGTTYYYKSGNLVNPMVYDGIQNALPFVEAWGPSHSFKSSVDAYINSGGLSNEGTAFFRGPGANYFGGNVGIGTYSPDERLTVNGKIHATEIRVNKAMPAPDYVFKNDYKLLSLAKIERNIKKNSHLSDVPSAVEMKTKGLNVSEMQMLLLEKVEALTLHLIEKDKDIEAERKINRLQQIKIKAILSIV